MLFQDRIETAVQAKISSMTPLFGGCIGEVYRVELANGRAVVCKMAAGGHGRLDIEGFMLRYLSERSELPVPKLIHAEADLLIMTFIEGESRFSHLAEVDAAEKLAALHAISGPAFGLEQASLIGGLRQPNPWTASWLDFFREQRLLYMAQQAVAVNRLPTAFLTRVANLCDHLDKWLTEPAQPALIHGDVWTTNVLALNGRMTAFLDPAIYYADPEIELAFATLFGTFGPPFFERVS